MKSANTPGPELPALSLRSGPALARNGVLTTAALANALAWTPFAEAQTQAPASDDPMLLPGATQMPEVVVRGVGEPGYKPEMVQSRKYTEPLRDVPQSMTVVPAAVIEEQNATSLAQVLRNVPGISMQAGEGGGGPGGDFLSIRGFNARNDIFVDGVRDFGGYSRDPFNIEQVEVVKGPASTYAGRGSTGGSINLASKTPSTGDSFYNGSLGVGTENYKRFTLDVNQKLTGGWFSRAADSPREPGFKAALRLNAMWTESDVAHRDEVSYRRWGVAPSLALELGENTRVTLSYFHLEQDNVPDYGIPWVPSAQNVLPQRYADQPSPVDRSNFYGLLGRDFEEITTDLGTLELEQKFSDQFSLRNVVRYGQTARDSVTTAPRYNASTDPSVVINRQFQSRDQTDTIIADQFDVRLSFETWGVGHEVVAGLDLARETAENKLRTAPDAPPADLHDPSPHQAFSGPITYTGAVNESITDNAALFLFDTLKFGGQWQLSGGLRWDYYEAELEQRDAAGLTNVFGRVDKVWSYRVALACKPVPIGTIYAAYGTSFNPSAEGAVSLSPLNEATAALEPEENRTIEIGTKWDLLGERLSVTAAIFRTDKTNARTPGLTPADPPTVLDGEQRVQGLEIGVAGNITRDWQVFGGYTYLDSEVRKSNQFTTDPTTGEQISQAGNKLPQTPEHSFTLWTTCDLPWDFQVGVGAQYVGSRFNNTSNLREAPDYWLFDAMISKEITGNVRAQINVYNIADEEYIDRLGGGHFIPGAGRTAVLTIGLTF